MKRDALLSCAFFQPMRTEELDEIVAHATERRVARGTTIFERGDEGSSMMAVLAGQVRIGSTSLSGREIAHTMFGRGAIFGEIALLDGKPRTADAVAVEDTTLLVVERRVFMPILLRHEGTVERMLVVLCERLRRTTVALEELATQDLPVRLARVLCRMAEDHGVRQPDGSIRIDARLSDSDLGSLVLTARETVNKQIAQWKRRGLAYRDGRQIVLQDLAGLRRQFE